MDKRKFHLGILTGCHTDNLLNTLMASPYILLMGKQSGNSSKLSNSFHKDRIKLYLNIHSVLKICS